MAFHPGADFEDELLALEHRVVALAAGDWLANVERIRLQLAGEDPTVTDTLLLLIAPALEDQARAGLLQAFIFGADQAQAITELAHLSEETLAQIEAAMPHPGASFEIVPQQILAQLDGLEATAADAVTASQGLVLAGADPLTAAAPILNAATAIRRSIETGINQAANAAVTQIADAADLPRVWVAERDACVICLAYAGLVVDPGGSFPGGLTYGLKVYDSFRSTVEHPPRHPNCRCHLEPLLAQEYADALMREAQRSVLRGYSLSNESMNVRIQAARNLLASPTLDAPQSVQDYAAVAVRRGTFRTRQVPSGRAAA
jgi:hypothetical protein